MKVLIIGLGSIARKHISALRKINNDVELFALRHSRNTEDIAGVENIYDVSALKNYSFDFIILSNPTSKHAEGIKIGLELNLPMFIEKPLFHKLGNKKLIGKIKEKGILNYVACNLRFLDSIVFVKEYLSYNEKAIHEVNAYCGSFLPEWRPNSDYKKSYSSNADLGGGVHLDLIHEIDYLYWVLGAPNIASSVKKSNSALGINSVDYANYVLEYDAFCASVVLNYYRRDPKRTVEIICADETITVDLLKNKVESSHGGLLFKSEQAVIDTYTAQLKYFISLLNGKKTSKPMNDVFEAYNVLEICLS